MALTDEDKQWIADRLKVFEERFIEGMGRLRLELLRAFQPPPPPPPREQTLHQDSLELLESVRELQLTELKHRLDALERRVEALEKKLRNAK